MNQIEARVAAGPLSICEHEKFHTALKITRLTDEDNGSVTGYSLDLRVYCIGCGLPFCFPGLDPGFSPLEPRCSGDRTELRAPIEPHHPRAKAQA